MLNEMTKRIKHKYDALTKYLKTFTGWRASIAMALLLSFGASFPAYAAQDIWLAKTPNKYAADGSAYCFLTVMQGDAPLRKGAEIIKATCQYTVWMGPSKIALLEPLPDDGQVRFKVESPVSSACNVVVRLVKGNEYYIAQNFFSLYGDAWNKESFLTQADAPDGAEEGSISGLSRNTYPQTGQKLHFSYRAPRETAASPVVEAMASGSEGGFRKLPLDASGNFVYEVPKKRLLEGSIWDEPRQVTIKARATAADGVYYTRTSFEVRESRFAYLNIRQGMLLFAAVYVIALAAFKIYLRRSSRYAFK